MCISIGCISLLPLAYLLGSIPTSVWAGKWFFGIDIREHGSGNAGATNAFRILGAKTAVVVLIVDMLKGMAAVGLSALVASSFEAAEGFSIFRFMLGISALLGHVYPVFAGFRGGKGIATLAGVVLVLFPAVVIICLVVFVLALVATRYVSLGSILAALTFPIALILLPGQMLVSEILFAFLVAVFVPYTHRSNIRRLLKGNENKFSFKRNSES